MDELLTELAAVQKELYDGFKRDKKTNLEWLNVNKIH
jgi:hypothetical protein